jgi:hypothetical protein
VIDQMAMLEFQRFQHAFTSHIRDPAKNPCPPGVAAARIQLYRRLVYKNLENFLLSCFPVLREVLGERRWSRLIHGFLANHWSSSPFFHEIPDEFVQFLQQEGSIPDRYPKFLLELAHYEWVELALSVSTEQPDRDLIDPEGCVLEQRPVLNPVLANLSYAWPVHRIAPRTRISPNDTYLLVFRDAFDEVKFIEINTFTSRLIQLLEPAERTGREALEIVARESGHPSPEAVMEGGLKVMHDLKASGALLGTLK